MASTANSSIGNLGSGLGKKNYWGDMEHFDEFLFRKNHFDLRHLTAKRLGVTSFTCKLKDVVYRYSFITFSFINNL